MILVNTEVAWNLDASWLLVSHTFSGIYWTTQTSATYHVRSLTLVVFL